MLDCMYTSLGCVSGVCVCEEGMLECLFVQLVYV